MTLSWYFDVDWDSDGSYDAGINEATRMVDLWVKRGRNFVLKGDGSGIESVRYGEFRALLDNYDGRYDPLNTSSPLYPNVRQGMLCRIRAEDSPSGPWNVITGTIETIREEGRDKVWITGVDGIKNLERQDPTDVLYASIDAAQAYAYILTAAGWVGGSTIEDSDDNMSYWWINANESAWDACIRLAESWMGTAFVAADGEFKFYARQHSEAAVQTLTAGSFLKDVGQASPWDTIKNHITVIARPRRVYSAVELWRLVDPTLLQAGDSMEVWADYIYNSELVPGDNIITPVSSTDYTANAAEDGGGADLTTDFTVTANKYATRTKLTIENTGSTDGYITLLKLRGDALSGRDSTNIIREDATSQTTYNGVLKLKIDQPMLQNVSIATDFANFLVGVFKDPTRYPIVHIEGRPSVQFGADLFDKIDLTIAAKNISGNYDVGSIEHRFLNDNGSAVRTTWNLEPSLDDNFWIWTAKVGNSTIFGF